VLWSLTGGLLEGVEVEAKVGRKVELMIQTAAMLEDLALWSQNMKVVEPGRSVEAMMPFALMDCWLSYQHQME